MSLVLPATCSAAALIASCAASVKPSDPAVLAASLAMYFHTFGAAPESLAIFSMTFILP